MYPLVQEACFKNDTYQAVPLDLWLTLGIEAVGLCETSNCFFIFDKKPDAAILTMNAAEVVRNSALMSSPAIQDYARDYIDSSGLLHVHKAVQNWLSEASRNNKKPFWK